MASTSILLAGFGGQGVLFAGKFLAYKGMVQGKQLSWLPPIWLSPNRGGFISQSKKIPRFRRIGGFLFPYSLSFFRLWFR